VDSLANQDL